MGYDCVALFSGGLDSILACKLLQKQGLKVLGIHFVSPFFGKPQMEKKWKKLYGVDIFVMDMGPDFVKLLKNGPKWGLGKGLNPCVDCKILMLKKAKELLSVFGADFIVTGEVLGQRPMSQRKNVMNLIIKEAGVKGLVLRPLSALLLKPTQPEENGKVKREELLALKGRGRKLQLKLAEEFGLKEIPTPAGGCLLTDMESVKRFWAVLYKVKEASVDDFELAKVGRQYWKDEFWLVVGRNKNDNHRLLKLLKPNDILFKVSNVPGPVAIGRQKQKRWDKDILLEASKFLLSFCKDLKVGNRVQVKVGKDGKVEEIDVEFRDDIKDNNEWKVPTWEDFELNKKTFWECK